MGRLVRDQERKHRPLTCGAVTIGRIPTSRRNGSRPAFSMRRRRSIIGAFGSSRGTGPAGRPPTRSARAGALTHAAISVSGSFPTGIINDHTPRSRLIVVAVWRLAVSTPTIASEVIVVAMGAGTVPAPAEPGRAAAAITVAGGSGATRGAGRRRNTPSGTGARPGAATALAMDGAVGAAPAGAVIAASRPFPIRDRGSRHGVAACSSRTPIAHGVTTDVRRATATAGGRTVVVGHAAPCREDPAGCPEPRTAAGGPGGGVKEGAVGLGDASAIGRLATRENATALVTPRASTQGAGAGSARAAAHAAIACREAGIGKARIGTATIAKRRI